MLSKSELDVTGAMIYHLVSVYNISILELILVTSGFVFPYNMVDLMLMVRVHK